MSPTRPSKQMASVKTKMGGLGIVSRNVPLCPHLYGVAVFSFSYDLWILKF